MLGFLRRFFDFGFSDREIAGIRKERIEFLKQENKGLAFDRDSLKKGLDASKADLASLKQALDACEADRVKRLADADAEIEGIKAANANLIANAAYYEKDNTRLRAQIADAVAKLRF